MKSWDSRARNDWQHEPRPAVFGKVQCVYAAEDVSRPIARLVVRERTNPAQRIRYMRRDHGRAAILIIMAADRQRDPIAGRHHDAGWRQFDVEFDRFAWRQRLTFIMRVEGTVGKAVRIVELAM